MKTIMPWIVAVLLFALLATNASAFPLSGGNGIINVTVFGTYEDSDSNNRIFVDLSIHKESTEYESSYQFQLIDSEDRSYGRVYDLPKTGPMYRRMVLGFDVPEGTILKRIKVIPEKFDPFSIDWTGVPEVGNEIATIKFYGSYRPQGHVYGEDLYDWMFDTKLTNNGNETMSYSNEDFIIIDQFGWQYQGIAGQENKLLPGESVRFNVDAKMFKISRPVVLGFRGLEMDISAWA
jgi:hypothetical protein